MFGLQKASKGNAIILGIGILFVTLMFSAFAIDMGFYYSIQNQLQTAANAGALAGVHELFNDSNQAIEDTLDNALSAAEAIAGNNLTTLGLTDAQKNYDVELGFVDPETGGFSSDPSEDAAYSATSGYNAVRMNLTANNFSTIMAKIFGTDQMSTTAAATAYANTQIGSVGEGVRPIYVCETQYQMAAEDGNLENNVIRIYGKKFYVDGDTNLSGCPPQGSGNWGFADLRDNEPGAVGNNTMGEWFEDGYPGTVYANKYYSTQPGNSIKSNNIETALDSLVSSETKMILPLINSDYSGSGSNTQVYVTGFTGFVITNYNTDAPSEGGGNGKGKGNSTPAQDTDTRYIEGYFTKINCSSQCSASSSATPGSVSKIKMISTN